MATLDTDVIIVGAGSTGLLIAQGLKQAGITFRIFERHSKDHVSREWSMSLHWGGEFLSNGLPAELRERLNEINVDPNYDYSKDKGYVQCNGETGEVILLMGGTMPRRVSRRKLRSLMSEGIDIEYNQSVETILPDRDAKYVTATLSDGSSVKAHILIGCDGSRSRVREILCMDEEVAKLQSTPYTILNFPYTYSPETSRELKVIHPIFKVAYHPQLNMMHMLTVLDASAGEGGEWKYQNLMSWAGAPYPEDLDSAARIRRLKELGKQFAHPWSTAIANVADDAIIPIDRGNSWDPRSVFRIEESQVDGETVKKSFWNGHNWEGLVTVAGDAAHAMLPHRGQGLNNALEDASRLTIALASALKEKKTDLASAVTEYEAEMVARGGGEVEISGRAARAAHDWDMLMQSPMFKHGANKAK